MNSPVDRIPSASPQPTALRQLLADRRLYKGGVIWAAALFCFANVLVGGVLARLERRQAENLLLAEPATPADQVVRYDHSAGRHVATYWKHIPDAERVPLIVVNGMSQMYAVNDRRPGDETISEHLDDALAPRGIRVFGLAAPNLDPEESLLYLAATAGSPNTKPALFVYGVCFDKMRNVGVRAELRPMLSMPNVARSLSEVCDRHGDRYPLACAALRETLADSSPRTETEPATAEERIRGRFEQVLPIVAGRKTLNASLQRGVFAIRNWVFRIKPTDKRPIIVSRYRQNQQLMELAAVLAAELGVRLVWYVIPLNPLADNPYVEQQYASFKSWVAEVAGERRIPFANLEDAVPSSEWGEFMGGPDFKHFRGTGHELTAKALLRTFDFAALSGRTAEHGGP